MNHYQLLRQLFQGNIVTLLLCAVVRRSFLGGNKDDCESNVILESTHWDVLERFKKGHYLYGFVLFEFNYCICGEILVRHFVNRPLVVVSALLLLLLLLLQTEEGVAAELEDGRQFSMTVVHRVVMLLQGQGGLVLLHVLDFGVIVDLEVKHERV